MERIMKKSLVSSTSWMAFKCVTAIALVSGVIACGTTREAAAPSSQVADIGYPIAVREAEAARRWLDFRQIDRIAYVDQFTVADYRHPKTDLYTEGRQAPPVDILLVVDNSMSMTDIQANLARGLDPLLSEIQSADWQIHVVTTDSACPGTTIKKGDPNIAAAFTAAVSVGANGDPVERGIKNAHDSLAIPCSGQTWLRANSRLAVVFVSNEDNCSFTNPQGIAEDCAGEQWTTANQFYTYLASIRTPGDTVRVYGIIFHPNGPDCEAGTWRGSVYADLIQRTNGAWTSICETDYSPVLHTVSVNARQLLPPTIPLTKDPLNNQVTVTLDGHPVAAADYVLTGRTVKLKNVVFEGQKVNVDYIYDDPFSKDFKLNNPAYPDTVVIESNGAPVTRGSFTYTQPTQTVSFSTTLTPNQPLKVSYRENKPLRNVFFVGPVQDSTQIQCFQGDGTEIHAFSYDVANQTVVFTDPPKELIMFKCHL